MTKLAPWLPCAFVLGACGGLVAPAPAAPVAPVAPAAARASSEVPAADRAGASPFELIVLGSGGPRSAGRAASSYGLMIDGQLRILVDMGSGSFVRLGELHLGQDQLDTLLFTHLHIDHTGDLPDIVKSRDLGWDRPTSFRVFGPAGRGVYPSTSVFVDRLFGANGAFAYLKTFRNELRFDVVDLAIDQKTAPKEIFVDGTTHVSTVPVDHGDTPAVAYRVEHAGHSVVVTGDLASKNDNVIRLAANADVLVYDTAVVDPPGSPPNLYELHTPPHRIGEVAAAAHVHRVVLGHIAPQVEKDIAAVTASVQATYKGRVDAAKDGLRIDVTRAE